MTESNQAVNLSAHFTLAEMTLSETAARRGLNNTPDAAALDNLRRTAALLEQIRALVERPLVVTSGFRSVAVNAAIGGAANSAHTFGLAADVHVPGYTPRALATLILGSGIAFDQLILEYDAWVHVGLARGVLRNEVLTIRKGTGYMRGIV